MNQEPIIPPQAPPKQRKAVNITIIISLILVPPVGLILMWLLASWDKEIKIAITAIVILVAVSLAGMFWFITRMQSLYDELRESDSQTANEYMLKAEMELAEVKKYLKENDSIEVQRHTAKALEYAISATNLEPQNAEMWFRRGNIYWGIKDIAEGAEEWALKSYQKAFELDPQNEFYRQKINELTGVKEGIEGLIQQALTYEREGDPEMAIKEMEKLVEKYPMNTEALFQLGRLYFNNNQINEAILRFKKVTDLAPDHENAHYSLGVAYQVKGEKELAIKEFEKLLELVPGNQDVQQKLEDLREGQ